MVAWSKVACTSSAPLNRDTSATSASRSSSSTSNTTVVVPGRTACLRCEDLHRLERDPAWPELLLQLGRRRGTDAAPAELHWAASTAALQAASWLAGGQPDTLGVTLVLDAQRTLRARRLRAHPGCGCGAAG